jgi:hypothetical protein
LKVVQQPVGQSAALQLGWTLPHAFTCESQKSKPSAWQSLHVVPPKPHALSSVPERHVPEGSQQPEGQVVAPQAPLSMTSETPLSHT